MRTPTGLTTPIRTNKGEKSILSGSIQETDDLAELENEDIPEVSETEPMEETPLNLWEYVGKIAFSNEGIAFGIFRPPVRVTNQIYLPLVQEERLTIPKLRNKYHTALKNHSID